MPPPVENPGVDTFKSIGCHTDSEGSRGLKDGSWTDFSESGMTVARCLASAKEFRYAGVEYGG